MYVLNWDEVNNADHVSEIYERDLHAHEVLVQKVDGKFVATIDSTAAGNNYTLGSITRADGSGGVVNINLNNGGELTLTGTGIFIQLLETFCKKIFILHIL